MDHTMKPMLCGKLDGVPSGDARWIQEPKLDGWRGVIHRHATGVSVFSGRNGACYDGRLPYIEAALEPVLPPDTVLDGELVHPAGRETLQGIMFRGTGAHVPSVHLPAASYVVFDILRVAGDDARSLPWERRRELLELVAFDGQAVMLNPYGPADQASADALIAQGMEGVVCKRIDGRYVNSRSNLWGKYKPKLGSEEAEIIGFKPGEAGGRFAGMVGAFRVRLLSNGAETTVKCGVDANHKDATDHPENWLGTIIEVSHHGLGATGVPLHPQFHCRRLDLMPCATNGKSHGPQDSLRAKEPSRSPRNAGASGPGPTRKRKSSAPTPMSSTDSTASSGADDGPSTTGPGESASTSGAPAAGRTSAKRQTSSGPGSGGGERGGSQRSKGSRRKNAGTPARDRSARAGTASQAETGCPTDNPRPGARNTPAGSASKNDRGDSAPAKGARMATKSAREKQVAAALRQMPDRERQVERFETGRSQATGRMRAYHLMKDEKLLRCIEELAGEYGDAYDRALNASGNPVADLEIAKGIAQDRGLTA